MKEINAAYDMLTGKNATPNFGQQGGAGYGGGYGQQGYAGQGQNATKEQVFQYVRMLLQMGDWRRAEMFLTQVQERTAEWHFLMGMIFWQSGRYDSARILPMQSIGKTKSSLKKEERNSAVDGAGRSQTRIFSVAARCVRSARYLCAVAVGCPACFFRSIVRPKGRGVA